MLNYAYAVLIAQTQIRLIVEGYDPTTFTGADFAIQTDGVCRLNPELTRRVAQLALERCEDLPYPKRGCGDTSASELGVQLIPAPDP